MDSPQQDLADLDPIKKDFADLHYLRKDIADLHTLKKDLADLISLEKDPLNPLVHPQLTSKIADLCNSETIVRPDEIELRYPLFPVYDFGCHGSDVMLVITSTNAKKHRTLAESFENMFEKIRPEGAKMMIHVVEGTSGVGEQPYNEGGVHGVYNRTRSALDTMAGDPGSMTLLAKHNIGTVMAVSIENYIQRLDADRDDLDRPVDYGLVMVHNATTRMTSTATSGGVTVPPAYVAHARSRGFDDGSYRDGGVPPAEERCVLGRVTVGSVLAANVPGLDGADWHAVLGGISRYDLLKEAIARLVVPW